MIEKQWHKKARQLFFEEHDPIKEIALELGISRQTVSTYLRSFEQYGEEVEIRKQKHAQSRKVYKKQKSREYRQEYHKIESQTIRNEHMEAVKVLSYEKF